MDDHWSEQYEETAKRLELLGINDAADDIRVLVDGLKQYEDENKKHDMQQAPRYLTHQDVLNSNLPQHVELPAEYFGIGVGPGSFDPQLMYLHALAVRNHAFSGMVPYETKSWVVLWLLDHVDWDKLNLIPQTCSKCGRDLHGFKSSGFPKVHLCRYCDPDADSE